MKKFLIFAATIVLTIGLYAQPFNPNTKSYTADAVWSQILFQDSSGNLGIRLLSLDPATAVPAVVPGKSYNEAQILSQGLLIDTITGDTALGAFIIDPSGSSGTGLPPGIVTNSTLKWDGVAWVENINIRSNGVGNLVVDGIYQSVGIGNIFSVVTPGHSIIRGLNTGPGTNPGGITMIPGIGTRSFSVNSYILSAGTFVTVANTQAPVIFPNTSEIFFAVADVTFSCLGAGNGIDCATNLAADLQSQSTIFPGETIQSVNVTSVSSVVHIIPMVSIESIVLTSSNMPAIAAIQLKDAQTNIKNINATVSTSLNQHTFDGASVFTGGVFVDTLQLPSLLADDILLSGTTIVLGSSSGGSPGVVELRSTVVGFETIITPSALTADRSTTFPDASGEIVLDIASQTLTNKSIANPIIVQTSSNVSNPPTNAELDALFGLPATVGVGFQGVVDDSDSTNVYYTTTDGIDWFTISGVLAL